MCATVLLSLSVLYVPSNVQSADLECTVGRRITYTAARPYRPSIRNAFERFVGPTILS